MTTPPQAPSVRASVPARTRRVLEAGLLVCVLLAVSLGAALSLLARPLPQPPLLNLNAASDAQIHRALGLPANASLTITRPITDVDALTRPGRDRAKPPTISAARLRTLAVRAPGAAERTLVVWLVSLAGLFVLAHALLRRIRPLADPVLLPAAAWLALAGVLLLFTIKDPMRDRLSFAAQASGCVLAVLAGAVGASRGFWRLPLHRYGYIYALSSVGLLLVLGVFGHGPGGVRLQIMGFQPVEVIKILMVFFVAAYLAERGPVLSDRAARLTRRDLVPLATLYALPLVLFALLKDLGPALILFGTFVVALYVSTHRFRYVALGLAALIGCGALGYALHIGTFAARVAMWLSPWQNRVLGGDQTAAGLWAIASGGPLGSGLALGGAASVPRAGSDLAFCAWIEQTGVLGGALILLPLTALVVRGLSAARRATNDFERLLAAGLSTVIGLQGLVILAGCLGLFPLSGVALPFLSYGKSSLVVCGFVVGLLIGLSDRGTASAPPRVAGQALAGVARILAGLLLLLCGGRMLWLQTLGADVIALAAARTRDGDGTVRPHVNPRLLRLARQIPRGRLLDRNGEVLAETRDGKRVYPLGEAGAHLVGWLDPRYGGPTFAEKRYDTLLRGYENGAGLLRLWRAKDLPGFVLPQGVDVALTLDRALQRRAFDAIVAVAGTVRDRRTGRAKRAGALVVIEPGTGAILAAATAPSFDPGRLTPERFTLLETSLDRPAVNRAMDGRYPPGSTFKAITAAALLHSGRADLSVLCRHTDSGLRWEDGDRHFSRRRVVDDESEGAHGTVNLDDAVRQSCNVFFARAGVALGADPLRETGSALGFTMPDHASLTEALPEASFGQGPIVASPLEIAAAFAAIGNDGGYLAPTLRAEDAAAHPVDALSSADAQRLAAALRSVTVSGTAAGRFDGLPFTVAGKTGTAQTKSGDGMSHSWFAGFAPAERPTIAFAAIIENGGYGARAAVPAIRRLLEGGIPASGKR